MKEPLFAEFPLDEYEGRVNRARTLMETSDTVHDGLEFRPGRF